MNKTFIFDYDDTLAPNLHDYSIAQLRFIEYLIHKLGSKAPDVQTIINLEVEIDKKLIPDMGFSMERFPTSFKETYRTICQTAGITPDERDLKTAYELGMQAFDEKRWKRQGLVKGAADTLDFLVSQNDELILLTKGDQRIQKKKIQATRCRKWFGKYNTYITPSKDTACILNIVGVRKKARVWLVGNSIRSDVEPALEAEINVIYIPCETWAWEREHKGTPEHPRLTTFNTISEINEKNSYL